MRPAVVRLAGLPVPQSHSAILSTPRSLHSAVIRQIPRKHQAAFTIADVARRTKGRSASKVGNATTHEYPHDAGPLQPLFGMSTGFSRADR
jgi:hypothetical protein